METITKTKSMKKFMGENNLFNATENIGRNGKTYFLFENSKSEVLGFDSDFNRVSDSELEKQVF